MVIFHSYVKLPEGVYIYIYIHIIRYHISYMKHRGANSICDNVQQFYSGLAFVHRASGFRMHKNNENWFCYKMRFQKTHAELASKFIQIRRHSETPLSKGVRKFFLDRGILE